jgi:hypothetical protein
MIFILIVICCCFALSALTAARYVLLNERVRSAQFISSSEAGCSTISSFTELKPVVINEREIATSAVLRSHNLARICSACATGLPNEVTSAWETALAFAGEEESVSSWQDWLNSGGGNGIFVTRRYYQSMLNVHGQCRDVIMSRLREIDESEEGGKVRGTTSNALCEFTEVLSSSRALLRRVARLEADVVARRYSHSLECGWKGILHDCPDVPENFYKNKYAAKFISSSLNNEDDLSSSRANNFCTQKEVDDNKCEPLCRKLIGSASRSRGSVDDSLSQEKQDAMKATLDRIIDVTGAVTAATAILFLCNKSWNFVVV